MHNTVSEVVYKVTTLQKKGWSLDWVGSTDHGLKAIKEQMY